MSSTLAELAVPRVLLLTGTDTGVGKTIATAAVARALRARGLQVLAVKPVQTGLDANEPGDADTIAGLAEIPTQEWARLPEPLAPDVAAIRAGVILPSVAAHAGRVREATQAVDVVLVEGAGGLLVPLDSQRRTLADLGQALLYQGISVGVLVVAAAGLGTLNATALTCAMLQQRKLACLGIIVGGWPADPDLAAWTNLSQFPVLTGVPLLGVIAHGDCQLLDPPMPPEGCRVASPNAEPQTAR